MKSNGKYVTSEEDTINHFFDKKSVEDFEPSINFKNDIDHVFDLLKKMNDKRIFKIFRMRYNDKGPKLTWKQIAEEFSLTPQTIINLHTKGRRLIRKKMRDHDIFIKNG
jgi:DNA-directed RNA polymerase sigma subunit (sigma70/sigma32)